MRALNRKCNRSSARNYVGVSNWFDSADLSCGCATTIWENTPPADAQKQCGRISDAGVVHQTRDRLHSSFLNKSLTLNPRQPSYRLVSHYRIQHTAIEGKNNAREVLKDYIIVFSFPQACSVTTLHLWIWYVTRVYRLFWRQPPFLKSGESCVSQTRKQRFLAPFRCSLHPSSIKQK